MNDVVIQNTEHQLATAILVNPFSTDGSAHLVVMKDTGTGGFVGQERFILDAAAVRELAATLTQISEDAKP